MSLISSSWIVGCAHPFASWMTTPVTRCPAAPSPLSGTLYCFQRKAVGAPPKSDRFRDHPMGWRSSPYNETDSCWLSPLPIRANCNALPLPVCTAVSVWR